MMASLAHPWPVAREKRGSSFLLARSLRALTSAMLQIVFNEISAAELSKLPTQTQFALLEALNIQPEDVEQPEALAKKYGVITHGKNRLYRCRAGDHRIYFAVEDSHVKIHRVLHKNTLKDFFFRSNLGSAGEDEALAEAKGFWKLIEDGQRTLKVV